MEKLASSLIRRQHPDALSRLDLASYLYLTIPFLIFIAGWLKWPLSLSIIFIFGWLAWRNRLGNILHFRLNPPGQNWLAGAIMLILWVLLSGIGGYAFQNTDFQTRNAIFHDLINYPWPVQYPAQAGDPGYALVYYIGFWLPAALAGKIAGWGAANAVVYLWAVLGVFLVALHVKQIIHSSLDSAALLLIFFSGMDALGVIILNLLFFKQFPSFWPPTQHIEWWAIDLQYSSLTTQLYWVFNQALPAWLCIALIRKRTEKRSLFLVWSLCFFYAPLPALGLAPLVGYEMIRTEQAAASLEKLSPEKKVIAWILAHARNFAHCLSQENILGGGAIFLITAIYFLANWITWDYSKQVPVSTSPLVYVLFILVEFGLLWLLLLPKYRTDPRFYLVGGMLAFIPFVRVGVGGDFAMRASIPSLFYLMIWVGESLQKKRSFSSWAIIACLLIGSYTAMLEVNRSIYQTLQVYRNTAIDQVTGRIENNVGQGTAGNIQKNEGIRLNSLVADDQRTLLNKDLMPEFLRNYYLADPSPSLFFQFFARNTGK